MKNLIPGDRRSSIGVTRAGRAARDAEFAHDRARAPANREYAAVKIRVLSDIHLEFMDFDPPAVEADVVVLAGDISLRDAGVLWAARHFPDTPVIYILGNHESYGLELLETLNACRHAGSREGILILENDIAVIGGVRFIGSTLWSDFRLYGDQEGAMNLAGSQINDFRRISMIGDGQRQRQFSPADALARHESARRFINSDLAKPFDGPSVVVSHFLPAPGSIATRFHGDPLTPYFCSDLSGIIERHRPALWIHGHTHDSCDYRLCETRVLCNPLGYYGENLEFDPGLVIEI